MKKKYNFKFKLTPQRIAILDYLEENFGHPSAEVIHTALKERFPTMSLATVYNTMETLKKRGAVRELTIDSGKKRFDPNTDSHHHLICIKCRKIVDIPVDYELKVPGSYKSGFDVIGNHVEFYGICRECKSG